MRTHAKIYAVKPNSGFYTVIDIPIQIPDNKDGSSCSELEPFVLQVLGDSMEPEFPDECVITIDPANQCQSGMYVMAKVEDTRWFRLYLNDEQGERLVALNEIYPEIMLENLGWKVEGIITQRTLRRHQSPSGRRESKRYEYTDI